MRALSDTSRMVLLSSVLHSPRHGYRRRRGGRRSLRDPDSLRRCRRRIARCDVGHV